MVGRGEGRIKQTAGGNLQQQTNHLHAHIWSQALFVRGVSVEGFERSHTVPGVTLRHPVLAALTADSNTDVKGVVGISGEVQEQDRKISAPLKGSCSCEKPVQEPASL